MSGEDIERLYVKHTKLQLFIFCLFVFLKSSLGSQQNWSTVCSNMPPPLPSLIPTTPTNERERERDLRAFPFSTILSTFRISVLSLHVLEFTLDVHFVGFDQSISPL